MTETDRFDWHRDPSIVVREQLSLAVYPNTVGHVVIRCERRWDEEGDPFFTIAPENAPAIAQAILRTAGLGEIEFIRRCRGGYEDVEIATGATPHPDIDWGDDEAPEAPEAPLEEPPLLRVINGHKEVLQAAE